MANDNICRYPWDDTQPRCGAPTEDGKNYCRAHVYDALFPSLPEEEGFYCKTCGEPMELTDNGHMCVINHSGRRVEIRPIQRGS
jgi:hypothetical protein